MSRFSIRQLPYHVYTIWLFTRSDLKTIWGPNTLFAVVFALADPSTSTLEVMKRVPIAGFWVWCQLLPFDIDNQRKPDSIMEDVINKPWRPLPSKRLTPDQAFRVMLVFYVVAILSSLYTGGLPSCLYLVALGYWYNDLRGSDGSCIVRNLINALGYLGFASGAVEVLSNRSLSLLEPKAYQWFVVVALVILTTIQAQDLQDQEGDSQRGRWTMPLVIGDSAARSTVAIGVGIWSYLCPVFWQVGMKWLALSLLLGSVVGGRFLVYRNPKADKVSFRLYNAWIVSLYVLPLLRG
ncbi:hypothetical protein M501DRAFT_995702 [Patellaria atrata CBS 101060]|uniref:UbiA prenyltransferase n=1 Tax=Patellaria atrata CBS 101060 TaxID=1346257 RepID=A0A9P4S6R5_9PEZI|nr:hypothetical protein M501DRAFT_995702 [Patellaria atrata CBS 101060]